MSSSSNTFVLIDYVVFILMFVITLIIGCYHIYRSLHIRTTSEFLLANRQMELLPVTVSLLASFQSSVLILGIPAEVYMNGVLYIYMVLGIFISIPLCNYGFMPVFYELHLTSVYEYLEMRFNSKILRVSASLMFNLQMLLYMGIVIYLPSLALSVVTGLNLWLSAITTSVVGIVYTALGGIKAVMWTDVFQLSCMLIGVVVIVVFGLIDNSGVSNILQKMAESGRLHFFEFDTNPFIRHSVWTVTFGSAVLWTYVYGINQGQIQRALCSPTLKQAQRAFFINMPASAFGIVIMMFCGAICYTYFADCDPLSSSRVTAVDQILILYVMERLHFAGLPGLFTASVFSAGLSTVSSGLNAIAAATVQDLVRNIIKPEISEARATQVAKIIAMAYGLILLLLVFLVSQFQGVIQLSLSVFGLVGGPLLGLFSLGLFYPWANEKGACVGFAASIAVSIWISAGATVYKPYMPPVVRPPLSTAGCPNSDNFTTHTLMQVTESEPEQWDLFNISTSAPIATEKPAGYLKFYELSYMYYGVCAVLVCHIVGLAVSFATGFNRQENVDKKLLSPLVTSLMSRFSSRAQHQTIHTSEPYEEKDQTTMMMSLDEKDVSKRLLSETTEEKLQNNIDITV